jgi:hypothetical protein
MEYALKSADKTGKWSFWQGSRGVLYPSEEFFVRPASSWTFDRPRRELDPNDDHPVGWECPDL